MPIRNLALDMLREGRLALGAGVRFARTVDIGKAMKTAGYDWMFIDLEHSSIPLDVAAQVCLAALDADIAPLVRVPHGEIGLATRALDSGALGIVMPHVESADEAREIVAALRLPPVGHRSYSGLNAQREFRIGSRIEAMAAVEQMTALVMMIESPNGVAEADAIAAIPGVDILLIGTNDLCTEMGIAGQYDHPKVAEAYEKVVAACDRHGKFAGTGGVDNELIARFVGMGARFILSGTDMGFLMQGAAARAKFLREMEGGEGTPPAPTHARP